MCVSAASVSPCRLPHSADCQVPSVCLRSAARGEAAAKEAEGFEGCAAYFSREMYGGRSGRGGMGPGASLPLGRAGRAPASLEGEQGAGPRSGSVGSLTLSAALLS